MRRILTTAAISGVLAAGVAHAETMTLARAMSAAREHAFEARAAAARGHAATARVEQARGFRLPTVTVQEMWVNTNSPAEAFAFKLNQERFSFVEFTTTDPNRPDRIDTGITRLEVAMPLYTGGELSGRIAQAESGARAARGEAARAADRAALAAGEAYVMLAQAREYVSVLERAQTTVQQHVSLAQAYVDQGMLVRSELLRAEVELSRMDDLVTEARGRARVAAANLAFLVGADQGTAWELEPVQTPSADGGDLAADLAEAGNRADLVAARAVVRAAELEVDVKRATFMPKVGVLARGDLVDRTLFGGHGNSSAVMAVASVNLFAGGSDRAAVAAARWEAESGRENVARFEEGVRLEVRQAFEEAATARARHATAEKAVAAARELERIVDERFKTGIVRMIDFLDAATARREAEAREIVTRAETQAAMLRLAVSSGRPPESVLP